jgi:predicted nucleic acid-binding protein
MGPPVTAEVPTVYIDANVFIAAFENIGAHSDHAWWILHAIEQDEIRGVTSEMTLAEVLVKPIEVGAEDLVTAYQKMIASTSAFKALPVRRDILVNAARLRAQRGSLRLPDAIHFATARAASCAFFISDDRRLSAPQDLTLLPLGPFTLDDIFKGES